MRVVSRSQSTPVTWTAGTAESMWVWVLGLDPSSGEASIVWCRTTDSGSFSIPAAAVALLPAAQTLGLVVTWRVNDTPVVAGSYAIELTAAAAVGSDALVIVP